MGFVSLDVVGAKNDGKEACRAGVSQQDCPYSGDSRSEMFLGAAWVYGWSEENEIVERVKGPHTKGKG